MSHEDDQVFSFVVKIVVAIPGKLISRAQKDAVNPQRYKIDIKPDPQHAMLPLLLVLGNASCCNILIYI